MITEKQLVALGIELPSVPEPIATYEMLTKAGDMLYLSGAGPVVNGLPIYRGKLGGEVTLEEGRNAARIAALFQISLLKSYLSDLDRVAAIVKVLGFVASVPSFYEQPQVVNGASSLLVEVFGERGKHARSAVGVPCLPMNIPVEIEMIVQIKDS